jgi:hypothetical protein
VMVAAISSNFIKSCVLAHFIIILAQSCSIQSPDKCYKRVFSESIMPLALFLAIYRELKSCRYWWLLFSSEGDGELRGK